MIFRDMLTGDYYHTGEVGYSHFISWARNTAMGDGYLKTQFHWNFHYLWWLLGINQVVGAVDPDNATDQQKGLLGAAYAFRALAYLDLARMYEFLPNEKSSALVLHFEQFCMDCSQSQENQHFL